MATTDALRTFVAAYRAGSVSAAARARGLSQPAASQQLAALERRVGARLLERSPAGVVPTPRGVELYAEVAEPLDRLDAVLRGLDGGRVRPPAGAVRVGASAEQLAARVVPAAAAAGLSVTAVVDADEALLALAARGQLDLAVTATAPGRRSGLAATPLPGEPFLLVAPPAGVGPLPVRLPRAPERLGAALDGQPWVAYSAELPVTRRLWVSLLGRPFGGVLRLVAPDLRAVLAAVVAGAGASLLPAFLVAHAVAAGRVRVLLDPGAALPPQPRWAVTALADTARPGVAALVAALRDGAAPGVPVVRRP